MLFLPLTISIRKERNEKFYSRIVIIKPIDVIGEKRMFEFSSLKFHLKLYLNQTFQLKIVDESRNERH